SRDGVRDPDPRRFTDEDRDSWGVKLGEFLFVNGDGDVGRLVYGRCIPPGGTTLVGDRERLSRSLFLSMAAYSLLKLFKPPDDVCRFSMLNFE
ncbi:hypothetical protein BLA29_014647, partial [Euroglyphus maynei]